jgi:hypothetical protein
MRRIVIAMAVVISAALAATAAFGSSVHFKKGGTPTCTITGTGTATVSVTCTGNVAGLGGENVEIDVTLSGSAVYQCQNPSTKNTPPGQNRVLVGPATTPTTIGGNEIKNGNLLFTTQPASLSAPGSVSSAQAGCPGANWTGVNPQLTLTDITLKFFQPAPSTLVFTCSAHDDSGLSGTVTLSSCTFA